VSVSTVSEQNEFIEKFSKKLDGLAFHNKHGKTPRAQRIGRDT
jgi:hypothetical protein